MRALRQYGSIRRFSSLLKSNGFIRQHIYTPAMARRQRQSRERLTNARKTLEEVEAANYWQTLTGTLGAEPVEAYL